MPDRLMLAQEIAARCAEESGASRRSQRAEDVALAALAAKPDGAISMTEYRRRIKKEYRKHNQNCGSFFLLFVLPVLVSLISTWISNWIMKTGDTTLRMIKMQAGSVLQGSRPRSTDTPMSTSSETTSTTSPSGQSSEM